MFNRKLRHQLTELKRDWQPPLYLQDWLQEPTSVVEDELVVADVGIAPSGSGISFHWHGEVPGNEVVYGRKRVFLSKDSPPGGFSERQTSLYWTYTQLPKILEERRKGELLDCTLQPGEFLYIPDGWYHSTLNIGQTVWVTYDFAKRADFPPKETSKSFYFNCQRDSTGLTCVDALKQYPDNYEFKMEVAKRLLQSPGDPHSLDQAARLLAEAARINPLSSSVHYHIAALESIKSRHAEAIKSGRTCLRLNRVELGILQATIEQLISISAPSREIEEAKEDLLSEAEQLLQGEYHSPYLTSVALLFYAKTREYLMNDSSVLLWYQNSILPPHSVRDHIMEKYSAALNAWDILQRVHAAI